MRETYRFHDMPSSSASKRLDGEILALFHLGLIVAFYDRHGFASVNFVSPNIVPGQVPDGLDC